MEFGKQRAPYAIEVDDETKKGEVLSQSSALVVFIPEPPDHDHVRRLPNLTFGSHKLLAPIRMLTSQFGDFLGQDRILVETFECRLTLSCSSVKQHSSAAWQALTWRRPEKKPLNLRVPFERFGIPPLENVRSTSLDDIAEPAIWTLRSPQRVQSGTLERVLNLADEPLSRYFRNLLKNEFRLPFKHRDRAMVQVKHQHCRPNEGDNDVNDKTRAAEVVELHVVSATRYSGSQTETHTRLHE